MTDDRAEYVRRLIAARVPELTEAEITEAFTPPPDADAIPGHIGLQIMEVLDRMSDRMEGFERQFAASEPVPARLH
jgi:hypothetical protein